MRVYCDTDSLEWAPLGVDQALFCHRTGETHVVGDLPAQVLLRLGAGPVHPKELARDLANHYGETFDAAWLDEITRILDDLQNLELIEKRP